jgi:hypothetical protein
VTKREILRKYYEKRPAFLTVDLIYSMRTIGPMVVEDLNDDLVNPVWVSVHHW